jgi:hypothetical protein
MVGSPSSALVDFNDPDTNTPPSYIQSPGQDPGSMYTNATPSGPRITSGDWRKREKKHKELSGNARYQINGRAVDLKKERHAFELETKVHVSPPIKSRTNITIGTLFGNLERIMPC